MEKRNCSGYRLYDAFDRVHEATGEDALEFEKAMNNIMPVLEVKARRVGGGANYQVPIEVRADRRQTLGLRWLTKVHKS